MNRGALIWALLSCGLPACAADIGEPGGIDADDSIEIGEVPLPLAAGSVYSFENTKSGLCIGVGGASTANGALIGQYKCDGSSNQRWRVGSADSLVNGKSGKCMGVNGASTAPGANVAQFTCDGRVNQAWGSVISDGDPPSGRLINAKSGLCLGVDGASTAVGAQLKQFACNPTAPNQRWIWRKR